MDLVFGFDGGGTSCRAAVADLSGRILGRGISGAANTLSDPDAAFRHIVEAAAGAAHAAGLEPSVLSECAAFLGLAGCNVDAGDAGFSDRLPFRQCVIEDDAGIALQGALGDGDGAVGVLGTGSVYLSRIGDEIQRQGGWGFVVGDQGSGAWLGRALLAEAVLAHDGVIAHSDLTRIVLSEFGSDPASVVRHAQREKPGWFAQLAPRVFEFCEHDDPIAKRLVRAGVDHVDQALAAIVWPDCARLALLGGVSSFYKALIAPRFQSILVEPAGDALDGAVQLALKRFHPQLRRTA